MNLVDFLFPPKCICCNEVLESADKRVKHKGNDALCADCRGIFEKAKLEKCRLCGMPFVDCICVPYLLRKEGCSCLIKLCLYDKDPNSKINKLIFCLKKYASKRCEGFLATQMSLRIKAFTRDYPECDFCITHIPRTDSNKIIYGYDHAERLAKMTSERCGFDYVEMLKRNTDGVEQKNLKSKERRKNIKGAFSLADTSNEAEGKVVIIVDDIITTGSSLAEAIKVLNENGFTEHIAACVMVSDSRHSSDKG